VYIGLAIFGRVLVVIGSESDRQSERFSTTICHKDYSDLPAGWALLRYDVCLGGANMVRTVALLVLSIFFNTSPESPAQKNPAFGGVL
jgi:hypothetical protein